MNSRMKKLALITTIFCFVFAADTLVNVAINITSESKVEMYTALFRAPCKEAKALLQSWGIEFESHMITFSRKTGEKMAIIQVGKLLYPK